MSALPARSRHCAVPDSCRHPLALAQIQRLIILRADISRHDDAAQAPIPLLIERTVGAYAG